MFNQTQRISRIPWGETEDTPVFLYQLSNQRGDQVTITNYGGSVVSWRTDSKHAGNGSIVLGFDSLAEYQSKPGCFGALIGRYANRIAGGCFRIDTREYLVSRNDGHNHCHGGFRGFDQVVWESSIENPQIPVLHLRHVSPDGDEGFPGRLTLHVIYELKADGLSITYEAETDQPTPVNLTNHCYFNLTGDAQESIGGHTLQINAGHFTPVDHWLIPSGEIKSVRETHFDFSNEKTLAAFLKSEVGGLDHNFVLNAPANKNSVAAVLRESVSGRKLEVFTTEPGLQVYLGKENNFSATYNSICLETQHFPNSPNLSHFPSTLLTPGETFTSATYYRVSTNEFN